MSEKKSLETIPDELRVAEIYQRVPWEPTEGPRGFQGGYWSLRVVGEVVTDLLIRLDGHNSLLRRYEEVDFLAPVYGGEYMRFGAELVAIGDTSRTIDFWVDKELAEAPRGWPHAQVLQKPVRVVQGRAICVVPRDPEVDSDQGPGA